MRQKPQITSSATSSTSYLRSTAWIFSKYVRGGTITPPAPMIGSAHIAATVSGPSARISFSSSSAQRDGERLLALAGIGAVVVVRVIVCTKPGSGTSKLRWLCGMPVSEADASVMP